MMNIISPYDDHHTKEGKRNGEREQSFQLSNFPSLFTWYEHSTFSLAIIMMMGLIQHPRVGDDWDYGVCDRWNSSEFWWAIGKPHKSLRVKISHVFRFKFWGNIWDECSHLPLCLRISILLALTQVHCGVISGKKNTIKAGAPHALKMLTGWWMEWIPLRLSRPLEHLRC